MVFKHVLLFERPEFNSCLSTWPQAGSGQSVSACNENNDSSWGLVPRLRARLRRTDQRPQSDHLSSLASVSPPVNSLHFSHAYKAPGPVQALHMFSLTSFPP